MYVFSGKHVHVLCLCEILEESLLCLLVVNCENVSTRYLAKYLSEKACHVRSPNGI